jgi:hypothetical protein
MLSIEKDKKLILDTVCLLELFRTCINLDYISLDSCPQMTNEVLKCMIKNSPNCKQRVFFGCGDLDQNLIDKWSLVDEE